MKEDLKSQFLALYCMSLADGIVDARELATLYRIGRENYELSSEEINRTIVEPGNSYAVPQSLDDRIKLLYHLCEVAWADGRIDETEKSLLSKYAICMGFQEDKIEDIVNYLLNEVKNGSPLKNTLEKINSEE